MYNYFKTEIQPMNDKLGALLNARFIPIKGFSLPYDITVNIDGTCNHAGAETEAVPIDHWNYDHSDTFTTWEYLPVCNKCNAVFNGEEWSE